MKIYRLGRVSAVFIKEQSNKNSCLVDADLKLTRPHVAKHGFYQFKTNPFGNRTFL